MVEGIQTEQIAAVSPAMQKLVRDLFPICRSITGNGLRETLRYLQQFIDLKLVELPTGMKVFDWTIPKEWNIRDAYIIDPRGKKIVDFKEHTLHVVNYSVPVKTRMSLEELRPHLHTLPDAPHLIPYRTTYFKEDWGFCLRHDLYSNLEQGQYEVCIDSTLEDGSLTYAELLLPGKSRSEVLFSTHCCHPSLCNDNLSGIAVSTFLARILSTANRRLSYRFLFIPGTIGAIAWLATHENVLDRIRHGLVVANVGDAGAFTYKRSRHGSAMIDRAVIHVLKHSGEQFHLKAFSPYGYDERQYCSPGINLEVGSLTRTPFGEYPEYHTSADNLEFIKPESLVNSLARYLDVVDVLERNRVCLNTNPKCEPQLGRRGLYSMLGGQTHAKAQEMAMLWILNRSDGSHSLLEIAEESGLAFTEICRVASLLENAGLVKERPSSDGQTTLTDERLKDTV